MIGGIGKVLDVEVEESDINDSVDNRDEGELEDLDETALTRTNVGRFEANDNSSELSDAVSIACENTRFRMSTLSFVCDVRSCSQRKSTVNNNNNYDTVTALTNRYKTNTTL